MCMKLFKPYYYHLNATTIPPIPNSVQFFPTCLLRENLLIKIHHQIEDLEESEMIQ